MPVLNQLILTVDYEVFGNGSGCVQRCVIQPLDRMAKLVEAHGARLEIFVDAFEFAVMESEPSHAESIATIRAQLGDMVRRGHQLQLHVHPQWDGAQFFEGKWVVDPNGWRIGGCDRAQTFRWIEFAHSWLRKVIPSDHQTQSGIVFRAGGWCIQPSADVLNALRSVGIRMDSSVAPGMVHRDQSAWYDFGSTPNRPWWRVDDDVTCLGHKNFIEVPIVSGCLNPARHIYARAVRRLEGEFAEGCSGTYRSRSGPQNRILAVWSTLQAARYAMLDYCALPTRLMMELVENWTARFGGEQIPVPVVAIGHTKNFSPAAERQLDEFLTWTNGNACLRFGSYGTWLRAVNARDTPG